MTKKPREATDEFELLSSSWQREVVGLLLVALGGVSLLALLALTRGMLSDLLARLLRQFFGWGAYLFALTFLAAGGVLLWRNLRPKLRMPWQRIIGGEGLFVVALSISHLLAAPSREGLALAQAGKGGGYVGWTLSYFLAEAIGFVPALAVLVAAGLASLALTVQPSVEDLRDLWRRGADWARGRVESLRQRVSIAPMPEPEAEPEPVAEKVKPSRAPRLVSFAQQGPPQFEIEVATSRPQRVRRRKALPPLDLLEADVAQGYDEAELQRRAQIIEETLASFGVPARVVECRPGPAVTQFGLEPGYIERRGLNGEPQQWKVSVRKVTALANDLSLALAASPIRIEAPVPGRSIIGIEVPNSRASLVSLRGVMESKEFQALRVPLKIALGRDVAGYPIVADLAKMPHLLIAGATGSGKSICINSLICCLLCHHTPETLRLVLIDPKRVELTPFNDVPHTLGHVIHDVQEVVAALKWVTHEMDRRYHLFARAAARDIHAFNRRARSLGESRLPFVVIFVDELAELMMTSPDEVERYVCRIAQLARATGIHLVISTQRPSVDVVTGLIKANFPARICFAVASQVDSRVVLDMPGAERLLGKGDMLFMSPDASSPTRVQGCFVSDQEIGRLVDFWREKTPTYLTILEEGTPWQAEMVEEDDELLEAAIELVRQHQQASVSFLQRRLRIGYPRAARLMDLLERREIVGPPTSGGRSREVLVDEEQDED